MTDQPFQGPTFPQPPEDTGLGRSVFLGQIKPVGGVGMAAAVLIVIATVLTAVDSWADWHRYLVLNDFVSGSGTVTLDDLDSADHLALATVVFAVSGLVGAGVVFLVWLWRARQNAENLCMAHHRRARGWVVGSWICPVVNLWFPFMILDDIHRASRPDNPPDLLDLRTVRGSQLIGWWWALWIAVWGTSRAASVNPRGDPTVDTFRSLAIVGTVGTVATIGAAVLIIRIMREISGWQTPRWTN